MSYIKNIPIRKTIHKAIEYVCNVDKTKEKNDVSDAMKYISKSTKTMGGELVSCNFGDWRIADKLWSETRKDYGKDSDILAHHFVQSFDPIHGVTPEEAHKIGVELAEKQFGYSGFDYIVATHIDKHHIHNHILVNNVARKGDRAGFKYYHNKSSYRFLRRLNIDVCRDYGVPAMDCRKTDEEYLRTHPDKRPKGIDENPDVTLGKTYTSTSYVKTRAYDSWQQEQAINKVKIRSDINEQIKNSNSWEDFVAHMEAIGYRVDWLTKSGEPKMHVTYTPPTAERGRRDSKLGSMFTREAITKRIEKQLARTEKEKEQGSMLPNVNDSSDTFKRYEQEGHTSMSEEQYGERKKEKDYDEQNRSEEIIKARVKIKGSFSWKIKSNSLWWVGFESKKYRVHRMITGKRILVPRSVLDQMVMELIESMNKKEREIKKEVNVYSNFKDGNIRELDESKIPKTTLELLKNVQYRTNHLIKTQTIISTYNVRNESDMIAVRANHYIKQEKVNNQILSLKKELLETDKVIDMFDAMKKYKPFYDQYMGMEEGKEKESYHSKYKKHIQNYAYALRTLNNQNIDLSQENIYKEKQRHLHEQLDIYSRQLLDLEKELSDINIAEQDVKNIMAEKKTRKEVSMERKSEQKKR